MRILLIEDDVRVANYIVKGLGEAAHVADHIVNGHDGLVAAMIEAYDVIVADRMLPGLDGLSVVRRIRRKRRPCRSMGFERTYWDGSCPATARSSS